MNDKKMPELINVLKIVSYDIEALIETMKENMQEENPGYEPTYDEVIEIVERMAEDEFGCGHGHKARLKDLIFHDELGNDI